MPPHPIDLRELEGRLAAIGAGGVAPLAGGASSLTYTARVHGRRVVVKVAPPGLAPVRNRDVLRQARVLRTLAGSAVPVPEVLWEDAGDPPGVPPLFVMSFVEGVSVEPLFDLRPDVVDGADVVATRMRNAAATLAALHTLDPAGIGLGDEPVVVLDAEIGRWCRAFETVEPALAAGWEPVAAALRDREPAPWRASASVHPGVPAPPGVPAHPGVAAHRMAVDPVVLHGDFRLGNLLAAGSEIRAVVDWEIWSVGDPRVDLGWFLVNADPATYDRRTRYAGLLPPPAELREAYRAASAARPAGPSPIDGGGHEEEWFDALACFKAAATWSLIVKHNRRLATPDPDVEAVADAVPRLLRRARDLLV